MDYWNDYENWDDYDDWDDDSPLNASLSQDQIEQLKEMLYQEISARNLTETYRRRSLRSVIQNAIEKMLNGASGFIKATKRQLAETFKLFIDDLDFLSPDEAEEIIDEIINEIDNDNF